MKFLGEMAKMIGSRTSPLALASPVWEILDPPPISAKYTFYLMSVDYFWSFSHKFIKYVKQDYTRI